MLDVQTYQRWPNLCALFLDTAARRGDAPCLWRRDGRAWRALSWREVLEQVTRLAQGLEALGVLRGERVAIVAENRPEWLVAELAILALGAVAVPAYVTNTEDDHRHVLDNAGVGYAIVSRAALAAVLAPAAVASARCRTLIALDLFESPAPNLRVVSWDAVLQSGAHAPRALDARIERIARDDLAVIFHTSGTGGRPRGVMLTHGSILANCLGAWERLHPRLDYGREVFLSFLPLSHAYEHATGQFTALSIGAQIHYCESIDRLLGDLASVRPTILTVVPRLFETLHARTTWTVKRQGRLRAWLFDTAVGIGARQVAGQRLTPWAWLFDRTAGRRVRAGFAALLGGRLKFFVSGGAPLNLEVARFFAALGVQVLQGYGQTEAGPVIACNPPEHARLDSVGPPLAGVELRLADDGEICVRGELVMRGYCNDEDTTRQALADGWLHTGDIGELDADGHLRITDRKKDIIVNSGGDNIAPQRVEGFLTLQPEIGQAMVYGDRRPHLVALLVPREEFLRDWNARHGGHLTVGDAGGDPAFVAHLEAVVKRLNATLAPAERVRRFALAEQPFTVQNGLLTPSMKIRRHLITAAYVERLAALYT
ncbi:MAG: long-chain fatty acid--CoA ligase [Gammaproteobacteria bacterium]